MEEPMANFGGNDGVPAWDQLKEVAERYHLLAIPKSTEYDVTLPETLTGEQRITFYTLVMGPGYYHVYQASIKSEETDELYIIKSRSWVPTNSECPESEVTCKCKEEEASLLSEMEANRQDIAPTPTVKGPAPDHNSAHLGKHHFALASTESFPCGSGRNRSASFTGSLRSQETQKEPTRTLNGAARDQPRESSDMEKHNFIAGSTSSSRCGSTRGISTTLSGSLHSRKSKAQIISRTQTFKEPARDQRLQTPDARNRHIAAASTASARCGSVRSRSATSNVLLRSEKTNLKISESTPTHEKPVPDQRKEFTEAKKHYFTASSAASARSRSAAFGGTLRPQKPKQEIIPPAPTVEKSGPDQREESNDAEKHNFKATSSARARSSSSARLSGSLRSRKSNQQIIPPTPTPSPNHQRQASPDAQKRHFRTTSASRGRCVSARGRSASFSGPLHSHKTNPQVIPPITTIGGLAPSKEQESPNAKNHDFTAGSAASACHGDARSSSFTFSGSKKVKPKVDCYLKKNAYFGIQGDGKIKERDGPDIKGHDGKVNEHDALNNNNVLQKILSVMTEEETSCSKIASAKKNSSSNQFLENDNGAKMKFSEESKERCPSGTRPLLGSENKMRLKPRKSNNRSCRLSYGVARN